MEDKIGVIRAYREITCKGLRESLDDINAYESGNIENESQVKAAIKKARTDKRKATMKYNKERKEHLLWNSLVVKLTQGLTLSELQSLKPERVRASNNLYEHLKTMCDAAEIMSCWDKMPNDAYYKAKRFLDSIKADGGK